MKTVNKIAITGMNLITSILIILYIPLEVTKLISILLVILVLTLIFGWPDFVYYIFLRLRYIRKAKIWIALDSDFFKIGQIFKFDTLGETEGVVLRKKNKIDRYDYYIALLH